MKKNNILALILIMLLPFLLSGCGKKEELLIYVGSGKISNSVLQNFEKEFGISVNMNTFITDDEAYQKIVEGKIIYDLAILPDYQTERLIKEGHTQEINNAVIVGTEYQKFSDNHRTPFLAGTMGLLYDGDKLEKIMWGSLWDTNFLYSTIMTNNMRDAISIGLLSHRYNINSKNAYEIDKVRVKLTSQQRFVFNYQTFQTKINIAEGRAAYGVVYSGEAYNAINAKYKTVESLKYAIPEEGSRKFVDCIISPKNVEKSDGAGKLMNYLLRADVQAENAKVTGYTPVVDAAKELMPLELQTNEIIFPSQATLKNCDYYDYDKNAYEAYTKAWQLVQKK